MRESNTRKLSRMGRRRFVKTLVGLGFTSAVASTIPQKTLAQLTDDAGEEVLRIGAHRVVNRDEVYKYNAPPKRKPVYYTIPREKWIIVESAHDAREQVENHLPDISSGGKAPYAEVGTNSAGTKAVYVRYPYSEEDEHENDDVIVSYESFVEHLPESVDGIAGRGTDVESVVNDIPIIPTRSSINLHYYEYKYRDPGIPAGCAYRSSVAHTGSTIGTPGYQYDLGQRVLVASGHTYRNHGSAVYQHKPEYEWKTTDPNCVGVVNSNLWDDADTFDACVVDIYDENDGSSKAFTTYHGFAAAGNDSYRSENIGGTVSHTWLKDHEGSAIEKQGKATGIKTGNITYVGNTHFRTDADSASGDSGGPHYREVSTDTCDIAGIHRGSDPDNNYDSVATSMEKIENRWNLSVV